MDAKLILLFVAVFVGSCYSKDLKATAKLTSGSYGIKGEIKFKFDKGRTEIKGKIKGLRPRITYGVHIHEFGDTSMNCALVGHHFDPFGESRGIHLGDLIKFIADKDGKADFKIERNNIELQGPYSVVGRAVGIAMEYQTFEHYEHPAIACGVIWSDGKKKHDDYHHYH